MSISFRAAGQCTFVVVVVMSNALLMSERYRVSGWVKMVMLLRYILITLVILTHILVPHNLEFHQFISSPTVLSSSESL